MKLIPIVFAVSLVAATAAAQPPDHRYRFDETGPTATDTGSGPETDGDLGPGAVRIPGVIGSGAIQFAQYDLNGYVNIPPSVSAGKFLTTDQAAMLTAIAGAIAAHVTAS